MSQTKAQLVQPVGVFTGTGINVTGVITATSFVGSGEGLTGVASTDNIITGTAATFNNTVQVNSTLTANSGFTTNATNTNLKVTGVGTFAGAVTAASFSGDGSGLTGVANTGFINAEQLTVVGVVTAATGNIGNLNITKSAAGAGATVGSFTGVTTYYGDGANLAGVGYSLAPWNYNPPLYGVDLPVTASGIGITFNRKIFAGSGNMYLKIANAGVGGTEIQRWGISSVTLAPDPPTSFTATILSSLEIFKNYQLSIDDGFFVDSGGKSLVGLAYTFTTVNELTGMFVWGNGYKGVLAQNNQVQYSSPVQVPGGNFSYGTFAVPNEESGAFVRSDGTLWTMGQSSYGQLAHNSNATYSSPVQVYGGGTTWTDALACSNASMACVKSDNTLWTWGASSYGAPGQNTSTSRSSPTQVPGTTWSTGLNKLSAGDNNYIAVKTDGTLWTWGSNGVGGLGLNNMTNYSSPKQIAGTNWATVAASGWQGTAAIRTDGTLWVWGHNETGMLGINESAPGNGTQYSSPIQVPGTTWSQVAVSKARYMLAIRTDGTLWGWGKNTDGSLGQGSQTNYSSPVQVPGTTWKRVVVEYNGGVLATKTDGTLWGWGDGGQGQIAQNNESAYSSPRQIPGTKWLTVGSGGMRGCCTQDLL